MNTKWLDDLWYALHKDYGTEIVYNQIGKAVVDYETGQRQDSKKTFQIPAVFAPVSLFQDYLDRLARTGKENGVERSKSRFLIRKSDLASIVVDTADFIVHEQKRYMQLDFQDLFTLWSVGGVATTGANAYQVLNVSTFDQLGLGDGV